MNRNIFFIFLFLINSNLLFIVNSIAIEEPRRVELAIPERFAKLRDPFRGPEIVVKVAKVGGSELEKYSASEFKMIGVITGPEKVRAMLVSPGGKTYFVSEKMKIGVNSGYIKRITVEKIVIKETVLNPLGQKESHEVELRLPPVTQLQSGTSISTIGEL